MWTEQLALDPFARGLVWPEPPSPEQLRKFSVIVIGAGLTGLNAAVQLRHAGIPFTVLEKNVAVGGTWMRTATPAPGSTRGAERTRTSSARTSRTLRPIARRRERNISTGWRIILRFARTSSSEPRSDPSFGTTKPRSGTSPRTDQRASSPGGPMQ